MSRTILLVRSISPLVLACVFACSSENPAISELFCTGNCSCTGSVCDCAKGGTCSLGPTSAEGGMVPGEAGASTAGVPNGVTYHCDAQNTCNLNCGSGCTSTCDGQSTCTGSCGSGCISICAGTSSCTLATGTNSQVTCEGGSTCQVTLDTASKLSCSGDSNCTIQCPQGGCTAECQGSATCTIQCGGSTPCSIECNGTKMQDCSAGSQCTGVCPKPGDDGGRSL
jgi:hypothetical protein